MINAQKMELIKIQYKHFFFSLNKTRWKWTELYCSWHPFMSSTLTNHAHAQNYGSDDLVRPL
jgi:hypothetical protein